MPSRSPDLFSTPTIRAPPRGGVRETRDLVREVVGSRRVDAQRGQECAAATAPSGFLLEVDLLTLDVVGQDACAQLAEDRPYRVPQTSALLERSASG